MAKKSERKLLRVATPIQLSSLLTMLAAVDNTTGDAIVSHYNGDLIITAPEPQLGVGAALTEGVDD